MIEQTYRILNKIVRVSVASEEMLPEGFEGFACADAGADVVFRSLDDAEVQSCYGIGYLYGEEKPLHNVFFSRKDRGQLLYSYAADYSELCLQIDETCPREILAELLMVGFYSCMSLRDTVLLHASAVCHEGRAIVFTAASGVGKTTQAELWQKHRNATIINGDKVFLTASDGIMAWGSPWKGSSAYAENIGAEAAAIVVLEQAEENEIRRLSGMEIFQRLIPHMFFPNWDAQCERAVLDLLDRLFAQAEVYLLRCRPDADAVALVEKTLF